MAQHDGNGWVACRCGLRHWGLHGAAGLILLRSGADHGGDAACGAQVLLQLRAGWTHEGGSWGLPGGARDSHEDAVSAALREAREEAGIDADLLTVLQQLVGADHGDWHYSYVVALAGAGLTIGEPTAESEALRWVNLDDVAALPMHPGLSEAWPRLLPLLSRSGAVAEQTREDLGDGLGLDEEPVVTVRRGDDA